MTISSWGTGRVDYSQNVEYSTEPVIRSWESQYTYFNEFLNVAAGASATLNIDIETDYLTILYDFYLSTPNNVMIGLNCYAVGTDGTAAPIFRDRRFTNIYHPIPQGFPFFHTIRIIYYNYSEIELDYLYLSMFGITTAEKEYYLTYTGPGV